MERRSGIQIVIGNVNCMFDRRPAAGRRSAEFLEYAEKNLRKGLDYYDKIYLKPDGKLFSLKKAFESGAIFDPDILRAKPTEVIEILIDQLCHFQFPEFNGDKRLLEEMKA